MTLTVNLYIDHALDSVADTHSIVNGVVANKKSRIHTVTVIVKVHNVL